MSLLISLHSESLKLKRTASLYLCFLAAAFLPFSLFLENLHVTPQAPKGLPWIDHFLEGREMMNIALLPLFIILISTLWLQTEYRDKTWKQVLSSPQKMVNVFFAKFIILHLLILLFLFLYNLWLVIAGLGINMLHPQIFEGGFRVKQILFSNVQTYFLILGISSIQFWLALRFKNFIAPLAIGFCLWFLAPMMIFELHWSFAHKYPYSYTVLSVLPKYKANIVSYQWYSIANMVVVLAIAFFDFNRRKQKV